MDKISYDKLFELIKKEDPHPLAWLRANGIHPTTVGKLKNGGNTTTATIARLCGLLGCQPGDMMEYINDGE